MKIKSMIILDIIRKEGRQFNFSETNNLIVSQGNTQGKSSLMKTLYYALGYEIKVFPNDWRIKDMYIQLECDIAGDTYYISRKDKLFRIIGENVKQVMNLREFSVFLQKLLGINMRLPNRRTKELHSAYASAILLPFYIDQDTSWDGVPYCESASDIKQYADVPRAVMEYVLGLSGTELLGLKDQISKIKGSLKESEYMVEGLERAIHEFQQAVDVNLGISEIDKNQLKEEITYYLNLVNDYNKQISKIKIRILNKQRQLNDQRIELDEVNSLIKMNKQESKGLEEECPRCHSKLIDKQALSQIELADNQLQLEIYREELNLEVKQLENEISKLLSDSGDYDREIEKFQSRIREVENIITIEKYIDEKSKTMTLRSLERMHNEEKQKVKKENVKREEMEKSLKKLGKEHEVKRKEISARYTSLCEAINDYFPDIELSSNKCFRFTTIDGSGMHRNKKYLATYLVYFSLLREYSIYQLPICMDSFIKNEGTSQSLEIMFKAIEDYFFSESTQSFFSIIEENIKYVNLREGYKKVEIGERVLTSKDYSSLLTKIKGGDIKLNENEEID